MIYSFDTKDAEKYGVDEAILLNNFRFWIKKNIANNKNFYDGKYWTYNSSNALTELFPFWNSKKIQRLLKSLVSKGVLTTGNYNKLSYDRTLWYAINDPSIIDNCPIHETKMSNGLDKNVPPIPDIKTHILNTDIKPYINSDAIRITQLFYDLLKQYLNPITWNKNPPSLESWSKDIEKINRIDGVEYDKIEKVVRWVVKDNFWSKNIMSGAKLRKQFERLWIESKGQKEETPEEARERMEKRIAEIEGL